MSASNTRAAHCARCSTGHSTLAPAASSKCHTPVNTNSRSSHSGKKQSPTPRPSCMRRSAKRRTKRYGCGSRNCSENDVLQLLSAPRSSERASAGTTLVLCTRPGGKKTMSPGRCVHAYSGYCSATRSNAANASRISSHTKPGLSRSSSATGGTMPRRHALRPCTWHEKMNSHIWSVCGSAPLAAWPMKISSRSSTVASLSAVRSTKYGSAYAAASSACTRLCGRDFSSIAYQ
mmetsp:Transcript_33380/g.81910  ORF Transcript_33380/g.81910 Transcript_33380/m.81910 type:complete len:233 (-) Transcript_33380:418-1116(-)